MLLPAAALGLVAWPTLVWSTLHGSPVVLDPVRLAGGLLAGIAIGGAGMPAGWQAAIPPVPVLIVVDLLSLTGVAASAAVLALRLGMWRGRSREHLNDFDPRKRVRPRAWARPRDWSHLQPDGARTGLAAHAISRFVRPIVGERRRPAPRGGDGWNLGRLRGREVRSSHEQHLLVVAPTRSGKTLRVVATEAHEHDGPLVVTSNKVDVVLHTIAARRRRGQVWVFAPMNRLRGIPCARWTPLLHCRTWPGALRMGEWLLDADPGAEAQSNGDGAAHFYDRGAVERVLPAVLHAAALADLQMMDVYHWLTGGPDALDTPAEILRDKDAQRAAHMLRAVQRIESRAQSILMMSAARLLAVYRFPEVQAADEDEFRPERLLRARGTLYLIAPESAQDALAPLFGGLLGAILRECEHNAATTDPRTVPLLKILADEAAHLAPLAKLPAYLAVSAGWGVRWAVIYQSIAQLRARYGPAADTIIANTLAKLFLGPVLDRATREELIAQLGEKPLGGAAAARPVGQHQRPKLSTEQLAQLGGSEAIAFHGRDLPALVELPFWWEWQGTKDPKDALRRMAQAANSNTHRQRRPGDRPQATT